MCESRGGRPGLPSLINLKVSVDVKQHFNHQLAQVVKRWETGHAWVVSGDMHISIHHGQDDMLHMSMSAARDSTDFNAQRAEGDIFVLFWLFAQRTLVNAQ